jgi:flagellar assembly protein FliH
MTFIALHQSADTQLGTTRWALSPDELSACESAVNLLHRLQILHDERTSQLEREREQARLDGFEQGRDEALRTVAPGLLAAMERAVRESQVQVQALRDAVIQLSQHVVQRIARELAPAEVVAGLVARAVEDLLPAHTVVVRVHPRLETAVREQLSELSPPLQAHLDIRPDELLDLLDCHIETPQGRLLAGLNMQLTNLGDALRARDGLAEAVP